MIKKEINLAVEMMEESIMSKVEDILDKKKFITEINELTEKFFSKITTVKRSNTKLNEIIPFSGTFGVEQSQELTQ